MTEDGAHHYPRKPVAALLAVAVFVGFTACAAWVYSIREIQDANTTITKTVDPRE